MSRNNLVIYGAGGLGREILCLARLLGRWNILGFTDDSLAAGTRVAGLPVLGREELLSLGKPLDVVIGFADPEGKARTAERLKKIPGLNFPVLIAPDAYVEQDAVLEQGCVVGHFCFVSTGARLGEFTFLNTAVQIGHDSQTGACCSFMPMSDISGHVSVGEKTLFGAQSFVLQGLNVGRRSVVGAGSRVFRNVPDNVTVFGTPAQIIRKNS